MPKIENTSQRQYDLNGADGKLVSVPRATAAEGTVPRINGFVEVSDADMALIAKSEFFKAVSAAGDLIASDAQAEPSIPTDDRLAKASSKR